MKENPHNFQPSPAGKLSSLPSLVRRLLCSCSSPPAEDSSAFFPPSNPCVATQTVSHPNNLKKGEIMSAMLPAIIKGIIINIRKVLWSSSRAASPKPGLDRSNLSHQLYSQDTGRLVNY